LGFIHVRRTADDDLVAHLAGTCGGAVEDATARAGLAENHVGRNSRPGILVPDLHEFHRKNPRLMALIRIERDRAVIVKIGFRNMDAMEFSSEHSSHFNIPLKVTRI